MGVVGPIPDSGPVDSERWSRIQSRIAEAGICIEERGEEECLFWYGCRRGRASVGLGVEKPPAPDRDLYLWCGFRRFWSAPLSTHRLIRDVVAIVRACPADARS